MIGKKLTAAIIAAAICIAIGGAHCTSAQAAEIAFVDTPKVVADSNAGKEAQKLIDDYRAKLNAEFETYAKTEKDAEKVRLRQAELDRDYWNEHNRLTGKIAERLRAVTDKWLKNNKKGYTAVVSKNNAISVSASADVSKEILKLLNKEKIDFSK